ncbi:hypothetical protein BU14_2388s0001 [Porphyra umbilicalis]|uniref:Hint domain-containing protein n=1 Tax=Porphyra umbilicalis TaxID=2786 RepID=A0A1X6NJG2_PORUM|nr:hypothetical protein BU14_2388s0001 [Porphyra umbilicalis]|eukprot:OSX68690.1 hypothetical protein BU14_2388s0001 [Porphyra umbilicalis]
MRVVTLSTFAGIPASLNASSLGGRMEAALSASAPARTTATSLNAATTDVLVGFDGVPRRCGGAVYSDQTFFFFIRSVAPIQLVVSGKPVGTITSGQQAMLIATPAKLCALVATKQGATPPPSPSASPSPIVVGPAQPSPTPSPTPSTGPSASPTPPPTGGSPTPVPSATPTPDGPQPTASPTPTDGAGTPSMTPTGTAQGSAIGPPGSTNITDDGSACFPAAAVVTLASGAARSMADLRVGDVVAVGAGRTSRVYFFSHADAGAATSMVTLDTATGGRLVASADHLVFVAAADGGASVALPADAVTVGDRLVVDGGDGTSAVTAVGRRAAAGLYAPHTHDGRLVVDGFVVSTYTRALPAAVAHAVLAPLRGADAAGLLPRRLAQSGLWAGGATPGRAARAALAAARAAWGGDASEL